MVTVLYAVLHAAADDVASARIDEQSALKSTRPPSPPSNPSTPPKPTAADSARRLVATGARFRAVVVGFPKLVGAGEELAPRKDAGNERGDEHTRQQDVEQDGLHPTASTGTAAARSMPTMVPGRR